MSAYGSVPALDPNDPRLTQHLIPSEPTFTDPVASALYSAGFSRRALRVEHCGEYKSQRCEDGHVTRRHRFCGTRTCVGDSCAKRLAETLTESFRLAADHRIRAAKRGTVPSRFTFVDFRYECEHTQEAIHSLASAILDHIARVERGNPYLSLLTYAAGLDDSGDLVFRILLFDANIDPEVLRHDFGAKSADVHVVPIHSVHRFLPLLFAVAIPQSESLRAAMEVAFIGIRRLRTIGHFDRPEMEELSVEEGDGKTSTNNSDLDDSQDGVESSPPDPPTSPQRHKSCPICHKRIVEESGWMPRHFPPPTPERTTFYPSPG